MSKISKYIVLGTMYRDGSNYKSSDEVVYTNDNEITDDEILKRIEPLIDDETLFIPAYYNMPGISPLDNEFINSNTEDHPFQTINAIKFKEHLDQYDVVHEDISELLTIIDNPDIVKAKQEQARLDAEVLLKKQLMRLGTPETTKIIVTVENGMVTAIGSNLPNVKIIILDYDKQADEPISISEQLEPDYVFKDGEAWKEWDSKNSSSEDKQVKKYLKKIKY